MGQIETAGGAQNIASHVPCLFWRKLDSHKMRMLLNARANLILSNIPGAECVVLIKIFDTTTAEKWSNDGLVCHTQRHRQSCHDGNRVIWPRWPTRSCKKCVGRWHSTPPVLAIPATANIPATNLPLDGILTKLRRFNGKYCIGVTGTLLSKKGKWLQKLLLGRRRKHAWISGYMQRNE